MRSPQLSQLTLFHFQGAPLLFVNTHLNHKLLLQRANIFLQQLNYLFILLEFLSQKHFRGSERLQLGFFVLTLLALAHFNNRSVNLRTRVVCHIPYKQGRFHHVLEGVADGTQF